MVVVAWAAFGSAKVAREFLADGTRGVRGVKPGLPVVVVGGENDGEVRKSVQHSFAFVGLSTSSSLTNPPSQPEIFAGSCTLNYQ